MLFLKEENCYLEPDITAGTGKGGCGTRRLCHVDIDDTRVIERARISISLEADLGASLDGGSGGDDILSGVVAGEISTGNIRYLTGMSIFCSMQ